MVNHAAAGELSGPDQQVFSSWVKATTFGWWLGFALIILLVLVLEPFTEEAQFMVGLGMGAGVGYLQGRRMDRWLGSRHRWFLATALGMGAPFVVGDLAAAVGWRMPASLPVNVAVGGLMVGWLQWRVLRRHLGRAAWWVPVSVVGWISPVALMTLADRGVVPGVAGEAVSLLGMFFGGVMLGAVTGGLLRAGFSRPAD